MINTLCDLKSYTLPCITEKNIVLLIGSNVWSFFSERKARNAQYFQLFQAGIVIVIIIIIIIIINVDPRRIKTYKLKTLQYKLLWFGTI